MCGRYSLSRPEKLAAMIAEMAALPLDFIPPPPRYNIAPTQTVPAIVSADGECKLTQLRWGLVPFWAREESAGFKMINARAESLAARPAFKRLLAHRRCLVPADGFYEWRRAGKLKVPVRFALADESLFAFAGLWDRWVRPDGGELESFTIITTRANELIAPVHDRMPVILSGREHWKEWMGTGTEPDWWQAMCEPFPAAAMCAREVSPLLNSPTVDSVECLAAPLPLEFQLGLGL